MSKVKKIKNILACTIVTLSLFVYPPIPVKADIFGGDVVVLTQILANALQQLIRLKQILRSSRGNLNLIRDVNRGINEALNLIKTIYPNDDLGIYRDWERYNSAIKKAEEIYGHAVNSRDALAQRHLDQSIIEAIVMYNKITRHSNKIDQIGENIKSQSLRSSPKGAARLSAQAAGVSIHVQNQSLRTQSAMLKLEAQNSAIRNKKEKEETKTYLESAKKLQDAMKKHNPQFNTPRY